MKLLTKTTLYFVTITLVVFFLGGIGLYVIMQNLVEKEVNNELYDRIHFVLSEVYQTSTMKNVKFIASEPIDIEKVENPHRATTFELKDTVLFNSVQRFYSPYRRLTTVVQTKDGNYYRISIYKSLIASNILIERVALITTLMLLLFILLAYFLNRYIFGKIWADFFDSLHKIQEFSLSNPQKEAFSSSEIIEFNELNRVLNKMIDKIINDYEGVKEFTGNLSHEVQTPLAVIKNKTDLLFQESLNEEQFKLAGSIYSATNRLSEIVRSLGLIARIDKNQFTNLTSIDLDGIIREQLENFDSLIESRKIKVTVNIESRPTLIMDKNLAEILINNLIKNAVRHNVEKGFINIIITEKSIQLSNSGDDPGVPTEELFEQFSRASKDGYMGIGLAIVRKITDYYGLKVTYEYHHQNSEHRFVITFS
jgi:signal transduction histidine kinase